MPAIKRGVAHEDVGNISFIKHQSKEVKRGSDIKWDERSVDGAGHNDLLTTRRAVQQRLGRLEKGTITHLQRPLKLPLRQTLQPPPPSSQASLTYIRSLPVITSSSLPCPSSPTSPQPPPHLSHQQWDEQSPKLPRKQLTTQSLTTGASPRLPTHPHLFHHPRPASRH